MNTASVALRLEGSEALIMALDDHIRTCELAKGLARERDDLRTCIAQLRLKCAQLLGAHLEHMRAELVASGWLEIRASIWCSPERKIYRGSETAWHALRRSNFH